MNVTTLQQEVFPSKNQALDKYGKEELKVLVGFFRPIVAKEDTFSPCLKGWITMRFVLTEVGSDHWQYVLVNSEA